jgi:hypothetical protein
VTESRNQIKGRKGRAHENREFMRCCLIFLWVQWPNWSPCPRTSKNRTFSKGRKTENLCGTVSYFYDFSGRIGAHVLALQNVVLSAREARAHEIREVFHLCDAASYLYELNWRFYSEFMSQDKKIVLLGMMCAKSIRMAGFRSACN